MKYHFSYKKGWLGNPCGLVLFKNRYHLFFLCNPNSHRFGPMHWGHAVSDDLITWEELPLAIAPDMPYENGSGCMSGSAIVSDGKLWLYVNVTDICNGSCPFCINPCTKGELLICPRKGWFRRMGNQDTRHGDA